MRHRSILVLAFLLVLPLAAARADIVLLEGNDVPLTGEVLSEDDDTIVFRIRGLTEDTWLEIDRSRVRGCWRDEGEAGPMELTPPPRPTPAASVTASVAAPTPAAPRGDRLDLALSRLSLVVPEDPGLRVLLWLAAFGALTLLLVLGGHLAEIPKMRPGRAAILALVTELLVLLGVMAWRAVPGPLTIPLLLAALGTAWVITARLLSNDRSTKAVLLLGFTVSTALLLAGSLFSVLSVAAG